MNDPAIRVGLQPMGGSQPKRGKLPDTTVIWAEAAAQLGLGFTVAAKRGHEHVLAGECLGYAVRVALPKRRVRYEVTYTVKLKPGNPLGRVRGPHNYNDPLQAGPADRYRFRLDDPDADRAIRIWTSNKNSAAKMLDEEAVTALVVLFRTARHAAVDRDIVTVVRYRPKQDAAEIVTQVLALVRVARALDPAPSPLAVAEGERHEAERKPPPLDQRRTAPNPNSVAANLAGPDSPGQSQQSAPEPRTRLGHDPSEVVLPAPPRPRPHHES